MRIIISGGGTGGHYYPAMTVADELRKRGHIIHYIGSKRGIEAKSMSQYPKISYTLLDVVGLNKGVQSIFIFAKKQYNAIKVVSDFYKKFQPDLVIGFGGYTATSAVYAAHKCKIPCILLEQNAVIGRANRFLLRYCDLLLTSFPITEGGEKNKKLRYIGNPIVERALNYRGSKEPFYDVIFVMGSQGSETMNHHLIEYLKQKDPSLRILVISGPNFYHVIKPYETKDSAITVKEFHRTLPAQFQHCDLVVSRAGASVLMELAVTGTPSILIPSPYVKNHHQHCNASIFAKQGAAIMLEETECSGLRLKQEIESLLSNRLRLSNMKVAAYQLAKKDALEALIKVVSQFEKKP